MSLFLASKLAAVEPANPGEESLWVNLKVSQHGKWVYIHNPESSKLDQSISPLDLYNASSVV